MAKARFRWATVGSAVFAISAMFGCAVSEPRESTSAQNVCTQEDIDNGTCGSAGGGWEQIPPSDPSVAADIGAIAASGYSDAYLNARCDRSPRGNVACCVDTPRLYHNNAGYCCKNSPYGVPSCGPQDDIDDFFWWFLVDG